MNRVKIKSFDVSCDAANRDLGALVDKRVNGFLAENPKIGEATVDVRPDLTLGYGRALVVVSYNGTLSDKKAPVGK